MVKKSAEQGFAEGQHDLGVMYEEGRGVKQDYAEAAKWYRRAADQGYGYSQNNLGWMYATGRGVPKDTKESVKLFKKATISMRQQATR